MAEIKAYKPSSNSLGSGQVLHSPYPFEKAKLIVHEMTDLLVLDLVDKGLVTDQLVLSVGYDIENVNSRRDTAVTDYYGRAVPKPAHGSINLGKHTSSTKHIMAVVSELFDRIIDPNLSVRRVNITANNVVPEAFIIKIATFEQLDLFTDHEAEETKRAEEAAEYEREKSLQKTIIALNKSMGRILF